MSKSSKSSEKKEIRALRRHDSDEQIKMFNRIANRRGGIGKDRPPRKVQRTISSINIQWIKINNVWIGMRLSETKKRYRKIEIFRPGIYKPIGELELTQNFLGQWCTDNLCEIGERLYPVAIFDIRRLINKMTL
jgi:hypothetical protein